MIYLSLFIASKFAITIPFLAPAGFADAAAFTAFPSRTKLSNIKVAAPDTYELSPRGTGTLAGASIDSGKGVSKQNQAVQAVRLQAAAPPIYLLCIAVMPFFGSVFIAGSRWWDYRHHGFDIIFGYLIGTICAFFAFRYYHLPISHGAGWAWGPRSHDKAFWAGVGSFSYATDHLRGEYRSGDEEEALTTDSDPFGRGTGTGLAAPNSTQYHRPHRDSPAATPPAVSRKGTGIEEDTTYVGATERI